MALRQIYSPVRRMRELDLLIIFQVRLTVKGVQRREGAYQKCGTAAEDVESRNVKFL
ncbi:hypothetical protein AZE42_07473 [Rhizopogon vesiculosus]|uniref:Uncharacterized protein n=1 Tax=Rhizopogon vesiculosus TaxID=180088 RepID=A0A1J8PLC0_9AGAM|nr:hypothetical protein AZE42_07473 [Rhizopogon vesiculosus]